MNIKNIIIGWLNRFRSIPPVQKALFDDRLKTCMSNECGMLALGICTACGCPVKSKTKVLDEECPENMWNPVLYERDGIEFIDTNQLPLKVASSLELWMIETDKVYLMPCNDEDSLYFLSWENWLEYKEYLKDVK